MKLQSKEADVAMNLLEILIILTMINHKLTLSCLLITSERCVFENGKKVP